MNFFSIVLSSEELQKGKPDPEGINKILKITECSKKNVVYIGDSLYDYIAAKRAKIKYLHATWGYDKHLTKNKVIIQIEIFDERKKKVFDILQSYKYQLYNNIGKDYYFRNFI